MYRELFQASITDPAEFWAQAAQAVSWTPRTRSASSTTTRAPFYRWFPDGMLNTCANALDRHVDDGRGDSAALIYDCPVTATHRTYHLRASCATRPRDSPGR